MYYDINNRVGSLADASKWEPVKDFKGKHKVVVIKGKQVEILEKKERSLSSLERFGRGLVGTMLAVATLGSSLLLKPTRELFTKSKEYSYGYKKLTKEDIASIKNRERELSGSERLGRGFLGTMVVVSTLGLGLVFDQVRDLFTQSKEKVPYVGEKNEEIK